MKSIKTTIGGALKILSVLLGAVGVSVSPEQQQSILAGSVALYTVGEAIHAYFTKDSDVTGGTKKQ